MVYRKGIQYNGGIKIKITLFGVSPYNNGGVPRYARNLKEHMDSDYVTVYKKEIIKDNKRHFGYLSSLAAQPLYHIKSDIIHSINGTNAYYKSNVITLHDLYFDNDKYKKIVLTFLMPYIIKHKLHRLKFIVPSELVKQQFIDLFHNDYNLYVVPHGIDFDYIDSLDLKNPFTTDNNIVVAGGVDFKRRNQIYLLNILKNTNYNVYTVGYGLMDVLKEKYKDYKNLYFIKNPPDNLFYSYLKYSGLNLYNTIGEGFGYIIYESLYLGKKMLVNDNDDNRLLFNDYADYYCGNDDLLYEIEVKMNKNVDMKNELRKEYSIKNMVDKTLKVYEEPFK